MEWIKQNIKWLLTLAFLAGSNFAIMAFKLDAKIDKVEAKELIQIEIKNELKETLPNYYNNTDGKVLEAKFNEILRRLDNIEKKIP